MIVYWGFLVLSLVILYLNERNYQIVLVDGIEERRGTKGQAWLFFLPIIIFCGLRSGIADTGTYIWIFRGYPSSLSGLDLSEVSEKGFYLFGVWYKQFISTDYHGWLFIIAAITGILLMKAFLKYASEFGMTCFLFIATTWFTWFVNGMRQFICIAAILLATNLITERKYIKYIALMLLLSTIHTSALLLIPLLFLVDSRPWSFRMLMLIVVAAVIGLGYDLFLPSFTETLQGTQYDSYANLLTNEAQAVNAIRVVLAALPVFLAFIGRNTVEQNGSNFIRLSVNFSAINLCVYFIGLFSSGMTMGRIAAYFDIYNLFLLPWLIENVISPRNRSNVRMACILLYTVYFWYQMTVAWHMVYESDVFGWYLR